MKPFLHKLLGDRGEKAAVRFLKKQGLRIIACKYKSPLGEIDIIARDGDQMVFVEVKTRKSTNAGQPFEAVNRAKQQKLTKLAVAWLRKYRRLEQRARFDVVSVIWPLNAAEPEIEHFRSAFEAVGHNSFYS